MELFELFTNSLPPHSTVVDLGAGEGKYAQILSSNGHQVIAVDKNPQPLVEGIEQIHSSVEDWITNLSPDSRADGFLLKNVIQFIDKDFVFDTLIPKLIHHLNPNGIIGIETFTQPPIPPFEITHRSHYDITELRPLFQGWEMLMSDNIENDGKDMNGNIRHFFITRLVARKTSNS